MAPESCNLGKDEAEILNPSSPQPSNTSLSSPSSQPIAQQSPPCPLLEPLELVRAQRTERPEPSAATAIKVPSLPDSEEESQPPAKFGNRCSTCQKRIPLSGFRCRCGDLFCSRHRYSDTHDCSFDYKAAGREEISKANPLIRAAKIIKI